MDAGNIIKKKLVITFIVFNYPVPVPGENISTLIHFFGGRSCIPEQNGNFGLVCVLSNIMNSPVFS